MSRTPSSAFQTALTNAASDGVIPRRFLWLRATNRADGSDEARGFWTGDQNVTLNVMDGVTGSAVSRLYVGLGGALVIPPIPRGSDLSIASIMVDLPINNTSVLETVGTHSVRFATADIHEGLLNVGQRLVADPEYIFAGIVDGRENDKPQANSAGKITLEVMAEPMRMLTRANVEKRSNEHQKQYSGDTFSEYGSAAAHWTIPWGERKAGSGNKDKSRSSGGGGIFW